jgi:hypothetical protein
MAQKTTKKRIINEIGTDLKGAKKPAKKTLAKGSRYAAVLTLRIEKHEIEPFDDVLKTYGKKSYSEAIFRAVNDIPYFKRRVKELEADNDKLENQLRKANQLRNAFKSLLQMVEGEAGGEQEPEQVQGKCDYCLQMYIDDGNGCPDCD